MKKNHHLLDDFLQSKVEETDFPYNEGYWEKMSGLLDKQEKKKKFAFFWRGLSVLIVLLAVGIGSYLLPKLWHQEKKFSIETPNVETSSPTILPSVQQDMPHQTRQNENNEINTNTKNTDDVNRAKSTSNLTQGNRMDTLPQTQTKVELLATQDEGKSSDEEKGEKEKLNITAHKPDMSDVQSAKHPDVISNQSTQSKKNRKNSTAKMDNPILPSIKPSKRKKEALEVQSLNAANHLKKNEEEVKDVQTSVLVLGKNMKAIDTVRYVKRNEIDPSKSNPRYVSSLLNYTPERLDSVTVITYKPVAELQAIEPVSMNKEPKEKFGRQAFEFSLLAGLNANKGMKENSSSPLSWAFSPYLGLGIEKQVSPKLTMASHIGFTYFNGLNSTLKVSSYQYGFGLDSSSFSVAHKKLLQFYLPVSAYYMIMKNHFLMAALGISYAFDVFSKVTEVPMSHNTGYPGNSSKSPNASSSTQTGYSHGFNNFDVFAQLGYSYQLKEALMLQCFFQQGFSDMTQNSYFNNNAKSTQSKISIGLKYTFKRN